jgi:hypothetical protein
MHCHRNSGNSFLLMMTIIAMLLLMATYPARCEILRSPVSKEELRVELAMITESAASECSARLRSFVEELEGLFPQLTSVAPVQSLFKKYFPLEGCDPAQVLAICKTSKYCSDLSTHPSIMVIGFDSRPDDLHRGIYVQFGVDRKSGDTQLTFVKVKI